MARLKTAWDKLSMNERALFIKLGLLHGLTDLNDIKGYYNLYSNGGSVVHKFDGELIGLNLELNDPMSVTFAQTYPTGMTILDKQKLILNYNWYMQELDRVGNAFSSEDASRWATNAATQYIKPEFILPEVTVTASKQPIKKTIPITTTEVVTEEPTQSVNPSNSLFAVNESGPKWLDSYGVRLVQGYTRYGSETVPANTISDIMEIGQDWTEKILQRYPNITSELVKEAIDNLNYQRVGAFTNGSFGSAWAWYLPSLQKIISSGGPSDAHELSHALRDILLGSSSAATSEEKELLELAYPKFYARNPLAERLATNTEHRERIRRTLGLTYDQFNQMIEDPSAISDEQLANIISDTPSAYLDLLERDEVDNPYRTKVRSYIEGSPHAYQLANILDLNSLIETLDPEILYNPDFLPTNSTLYQTWKSIQDQYNPRYGSLYLEKKNELDYKYKRAKPGSLQYQKYENELKELNKQFRQNWDDIQYNFREEHLDEIKPLILEQIKKYKPSQYYISDKNKEVLNNLRKALKTIAYNTTNPFEVSNGTHLAALGGQLAHKKSGELLGESLDLNYPNLLPEVEVYPKWYDLEWAKRSAAGLSALGTIATYIPHPYVKAAGLIAQVPDMYYDTKSLVSDVKNTDNWIDEGLNTLILDPFFRKKRPLIERLGKGADYLGPFKKINIPLSALDAVNDGYYAITGNKLSKDVLSLVDNKKSTGGPLYPFSFEKNPFLKTPVVRYDEGGQKQDASNPGGYTDEQINKNYLIWKTYDPTGGLNFFNYIASQNSGNLARGEENEYWKEYLGLNSAVPLMTSNAYTEWDKQIEAQKTQNGELTSDFYGTTPRMDYNILALADTLMLGNMVRNYEEYDKMYDLPHIETITQAYEQAKNILNNPNQWTFVDGEIPIGGYRYDSKTSETNPLGMLSHFGMKWVPEENALYMHDTYDFPNKVYTFTDIPIRPREMKIRSKINFDPIRGSWLLRSPVNYNTQIPVTVTK